MAKKTGNNYLWLVLIVAAVLLLAKCNPYANSQGAAAQQVSTPTSTTAPSGGGLGVTTTIAGVTTTAPAITIPTTTTQGNGLLMPPPTTQYTGAFYNPFLNSCSINTNDIGTQKTCTVGSTVYYNHCQGGTTLVDYHCASNACAYTLVDCTASPGGYCYQGQCLTV